MRREADRVYFTVEKMVRPILRSNAKRFARQLGMSVDDAMQEARCALMQALTKYDYNRARGGIFLFMKEVIRNHFLKLAAQDRTRQRRPHLKTRDDKGKRVTLRLPQPGGPPKDFLLVEGAPADLMDLFESGGVNALLMHEIERPDVSVVRAELAQRTEAFRLALEDALKYRDREVLRCKTDPPRGLRMLMIEDLAQEPTIYMIGTYLGLSKNEVDWAFRRIREAAKKLIVTEFSDLSDLPVVRSYVERRP